MSRAITQSVPLANYAPLDWADCATPGCDNKVCTWLNIALCFPCAARVDRNEWKATIGDPKTQDKILAAAGSLDEVRVSYNRTHPGLDWDTRKP